MIEINFNSILSEIAEAEMISKKQKMLKQLSRAQIKGARAGARHRDRMLRAKKARSVIIDIEDEDIEEEFELELKGDQR